MEYVKCPNCGSDTPSILTRCRQCGERMIKKVEEEEISVPKQRNGFVSFWLWMCLVVCSLITIGYFALLFSSKGLYTGTPEPILLRLYWLAGSAVTVAGYYLLIKWQRKGFYILAALAILNGIVNLILAPSAMSLVSALASIIILYFILQISKNGKTCWELLS